MRRLLLRHFGLAAPFKYLLLVLYSSPQRRFSAMLHADGHLAPYMIEITRTAAILLAFNAE